MKKSIHFIVVFVCIALMKSSLLQAQNLQSYRDIPGLTPGEIQVIESFRAAQESFVFGVRQTTEAFPGDGDTVAGFTALFCERLSQLFGIEFTPRFYYWGQLEQELQTGTVDFSGDFAPGFQAPQVFYATDPIIQRSIKIFRNSGTDSLSDIAKKREIRCAFLDESTAYAQVASAWELPFDPIFISSAVEVPELLSSGAIDAYIDEDVIQAFFETHEFIVAEDFFPLRFAPVAVTTANPELRVFIDVLQKYLHNGGFYEITRLYNQGEQDYLSHKLSLLLTAEEKEYILQHSDAATAVLMACETENYPASFYNQRDREFQGAALDVMKHISELTGLHIAIGNDPNVGWAQLLDGLEIGEYAVVSGLLRTNQRQNRFLWPDEPYFVDHHALISRANYPDITINQIAFSRVGLIEATGYADEFREWFPGNSGTLTYANAESAIEALENGEIDLLMGTTNLLLHMTNFLEKPGFKVNIDFNCNIDSYFGISQTEPLLRSIISKALRCIDTKEIVAQWSHKVFDYNSKMFRDVYPYLLGFVVVLTAGLVTVLFLFIKNRRMSRNLEKLVYERTDALALETSTLTTVFESIPDLVFCKDLDLCFTRCNKSFAAYFGHRIRDILGKNDVTGLGMPHEVASRIREDDLKVVYGRRAVAVEEIILDANGNARLFETIKTPLLQNGLPIGLMGIARDITRYKEAREAAQAASRAKSDFLSRMSHEIRTPLNAIIGMLAIAMKTGDQERIKHCLKRADAASKHLLGVINDILDMSKIEADRFELSLNEFHFEQMLTNVSNVINVRVEEKKQNFVIHLGENIPPYLIGDELRLAQVVTNLLSNAVKFTPEGGTVTLSAEQIAVNGDEVTLQISVEDTGIGISGEQQTRLFNSFEQADGGIARKFGGTGLGLAISKRIIEMMDGRVWIESELGQGAKFIFTLRVRLGREEGEQSEVAFEYSRSFTGHTILVAEDVEVNREIVAAVLEESGVGIDFAENGRMAVEMFQTHHDRYSMILMDVHMPELNGYEATQTIRASKLGRAQSIPIVAMTANVFREDIENCLQSGMNDHIGKPLDPAVLFAKLAHYLNA